MIELFFVTSPNVHKIMIALEEMGLEYECIPIDLSKGDHHVPENVAGSITSKLPVIRDQNPAFGTDPMVIFESGAILQYLGEKTTKFLPAEPQARFEVMKWLFWQIGGLGPIGGQLWHFMFFAPQIAPDFDNSYSYRRYTHMYSQLWDTMNRRLADNEYLAGAYSIADMACYPWIKYIDPEEGVDAFPNVKRWRDVIAKRPAINRCYQRSASVKDGYERNEKGASLFPLEGIIKNTVVT